MLCLTRRPDEQIVLHNLRTGEVLGRVKVFAVDGDKVKLSFDMPAHVGVDREEVYRDKVRDGVVRGVHGGGGASGGGAR